MKHELSIGISFFCFFTFFTLCSQRDICDIEVSQENTCIQNSMGLRSLLHSIGQMHQIIQNGICDELQPKVITESGSYHILENIENNIVVDADNVYIDLHGFTIKGKADGPVILIKEGRQNVVIKHGTICGHEDIRSEAYCGEGEFSNGVMVPSVPPTILPTNVGIVAEGNTKLIKLEDLNVTKCQNGVYFAGQEGKEITCCKVHNCFVSDCQNAFLLYYTKNSVFEDCDTCCCLFTGFGFYYSRFNKIKKCKSIKIGNNLNFGSSVGFMSLSGKDNLFYECFAEGIFKCKEGNFCTKATGFLLGCDENGPGEAESKIVNCFVDSITSFSFSNACGIQLGMCFKEEVGCPVAAGRFFEDGAITDIAWSPVGDKIAISFGGEDASLKILQFDCCAWSEIFTSTDITNGDNRHLEWDPTGRYLAITTDSYEDAAIFDAVKHASVAVAADARIEAPFRGISNPVWARSGNYVLVIVPVEGTGTVVGVYRISELGLEFVFLGVPLDAEGKLLKVSANPAVSPDEKFLALGGISTGFSPQGVKGVTKVTASLPNLYIYDWSWDFKFRDEEMDSTTEMLPIVSVEPTSLLIVKDIAFCPIACNKKYYIAVVGTRGPQAPFPNIELFEFDGTNSVKSITTEVFDSDLFRVKWAPNGKYFAVFGTSGYVAIYKFNPTPDVSQGEEILTKVYTYSLDGFVTTGGIDWSPLGRYLIVGGDPVGVSNNFAVLEVGVVPTKCMIVDNKIANVTGGLCGIGIDGANSCNTIAQNICYECDLNFSRKILDVWYCGQVGIDQLHYNISISPY